MLIRFAFADLDLHRLEADPDPRNAASIAVLERQGFTREGLLRERYLLDGEPQDAAYYGLLRREWPGAEGDNWLLRGSVIGGIYGRPLALANLLHFVMVAIMLLRWAVAGVPPGIAVLSGIYAAFAVGFAAVMFREPRP